MATHVNTSTLVAKSIKAFSCVNFAPSTRLFDSDCQSKIDSVEFFSDLDKAWKANAEATVRLIFHMGKAKQMRWAFRFAMRWLYDSHRETFMRNVESIQDLMSLQELLEVTTFCLVPMDDELFGILAAYERHFQSKGANYRMKDSYQRAYKTEGWRNQQRQAFADAKQIPLSELFVPKYVADEYYTKILNLRDEVDQLWDLADTFYCFSKGPLRDFLSEDFVYHRGCFGTGGEPETDIWLNEKQANWWAPGRISGKFKSNVPLLVQHICLQNLLFRIQTVLLHAYGNMDENFIPQKTCTVDWYSPGTRVSFYPKVLEYKPPVVYETTLGVIMGAICGVFWAMCDVLQHVPLCWVMWDVLRYMWKRLRPVPECKEVAKHLPERFWVSRRETELQQIVSWESTYNFMYFDWYGGSYDVKPEDIYYDSSYDDIDSWVTLVRQIRRNDYHVECFYYPSVVAFDSSLAQMRRYETTYEELHFGYYMGIPWTRSDLVQLRDCRTLKINHTRLLVLKVWATDDLVKEFDEFLQLEQSMKSAREKLRKQKKQLLQEKNVHMSLRGNVLFLKVRDIFVDGLNLELRDLHEGSRNSFDSKRIVGIYAKWAPSLKHHHDKALGMGRAIAEKLAVELGWVADTDEMTQAAWKQFVRYRYHHDVLSPIRRAAKVPESFIGRGEWHLIDYNRVSSWCMQTQKKLFVKHDAEGLATFMNDVVSGGAKIHTGKLLPAAIFKDCISAYVESDSGVFSKRLIEMYLSEEFGTEDSVTDGSGMDTIQENPCSMLSTMQWDSMCAEMLRKTTHKNPRVNCMIPIIDNMSVEYQLTAVSFSLLLAQCSHPESLFHKRIISCCGVKAAIHSITGEYGETCVDAAKSILISIMLGNYCDINEPYASVYDSIDLVVRDALHNGVTDEELATWTFVVFSDRNLPDKFGTLRSRWYLDMDLPYQKMQKRFMRIPPIPNADKLLSRSTSNKKRFYTSYPALVFWRLEDDFDETCICGVPVENDTVAGVILASGTSQQDLLDLMQGNITANSSTKSNVARALSRKLYDQLSV